MNSPRSTVSLLAACAVLALTGDARADQHDDAEQAFREGRKLLDAGQFEQACARLAESQKLEPAAGTLLNLADCYERRGLVASAADTYKEAAIAAALRSRTDWEQFALTRYGTLRTQVPKLTVRVPAASRVEGLVVARDGKPLAIGEAVEEMLDPGAHSITATAPGRKPWTTTLQLTAGSTRSIDVPLLEAPPAERPQEPAGDTWHRPTGFVLGGIGIAALGLGAVSGLVAMSGRSDAESKCPSYPNACTQEGTDANERARDWATMSTIGFVAGGVLLGAGVVLVLAAPSKGSGSARVGLTAPGRLELSGTF